VYKEIFIQNKAEDYEDEPYIELSETVEIKGVFYDLRIRHSMIESEDMLQAIFLPLLFMLLSAFVLSFFINKRFNRTVWKDFKENLRAIESYSFAQEEKLNLKKSDILEFDRLNTVVSRMTNKLGKDYKLLKQFTENASHELQTPLTIISLHLEELLQEDLPQKQMEKIYAAFQSVKRMDKLNKSLLLLTKIENKQFAGAQQIDIGSLFNQKLNEYQVLAESKNIQIIKELNEKFEVSMNPDLAATLVNNLLMNALRHNMQNGKIRVLSKPNETSICNTGAKDALDETEIFKRFVKYNSSSNGLGLAIVKEICNSSGLEVVYSFKEGQHCFRIKRGKQ
ncbi:MAG: HAMP domain-containing histidine kinase, partial [Chlorobi bacterium]|nr:HAMP domain-containing histidine kinase [Chlorobiota bacterium]